MRETVEDVCTESKQKTEKVRERNREERERVRQKRGMRAEELRRHGKQGQVLICVNEDGGGIHVRNGRANNNRKNESERLEIESVKEGRQ